MSNNLLKTNSNGIGNTREQNNIDSKRAQKSRRFTHKRSSPPRLSSMWLRPKQDLFLWLSRDMRVFSGQRQGGGAPTATFSVPETTKAVMDKPTKSWIVQLPTPGCGQQGSARAQLRSPLGAASTPWLCPAEDWRDEQWREDTLQCWSNNFPGDETQQNTTILVYGHIFFPLKPHPK